MNPAFVIILFLLCVLIWFLVYKLYKPIGKLIKRVWDNSQNAMKEKEKQKDE